MCSVLLRRPSTIDDILALAGLSKTIVTDKGEYTYSTAKANSLTGDTVASIRYASNQWNYIRSGSTRNRDLTDLYLIYTKPIGTIETVDSVSLGVKMNIMN